MEWAPLRRLGIGAVLWLPTVAVKTGRAIVEGVRPAVGQRDDAIDGKRLVPPVADNIHTGVYTLAYLGLHRAGMARDAASGGPIPGCWRACWTI